MVVFYHELCSHSLIFHILNLRMIVIDVLSCSIGVIISEQTSICKLFGFAEHSNTLFFIVYVKSFILVFPSQRSPFPIAAFEVTFEFSFIKLLAFIYLNPLSLFQIVRIEPLIQFIPLLLDALPISKTILEIPNINPLISIMHPNPMRLPIFPLPTIILKPNLLLYLNHPNHSPFPRPSVIHKIAYIEIPIFVNLHPTTISFIEEQFPFIDLPLLADDQPLPMPLSIHYCSYIQLIIIDRYFGTSESLEICKSSRIAFKRVEGHKVF